MVLNTEFAGREFACIRNELKIGRFDDNDIALDHRSLSRTHCKVVREETGEWRVIDLQSANGLMVNGEPYAQVALRSGDVIELGHLKMKFVGPGETFTLSATSDGVKVRAGGSKAPLIGVAILVLAAGLAAFYFLVLKKRHLKEQPNVVVVDNPTPDNPAVDNPGIDTVKPPINPDENPEALRAERDATMAEAQKLIDSLEWDDARKKLLTIKIDGQLDPAAKKLIDLIDSEKGMKKALDEADVLIDQGQLEKAKVEVNASEGTKLLKARHAEVAAKLKDAVEKKVAENTLKQPEPKPNPEPKPEPGLSKPGDVVRAMTDKGRAYLKAKDYPEAKKVLLDCLKVDGKAFECAKLLGSVYARLGENEPSVRYYRKFLELAPPDHPDRSKVQAMLDAAGR